MAETKEQHRICVLGSQGVGKSALVCSFVSEQFIDQDDPTVEDNYDHVVNCDGVPALLHILDSGGESEYYQSLHKKWFSQASGFVILYSVCSEYTFSLVTKYLQDIQKIKQVSFECIPKVIVGTQVDSVADREVTTSEGMKLAERFAAHFVEASAKSGEGVQEVFLEIVRALRTPAKLMPKPNLSPSPSKKFSSASMRGFPSKQSREPSGSIGKSTGRKSQSFPFLDASEDNWSTVVASKMDWTEVEAPPKEVSSAFSSMISSSSREEGFHIEFGRKKVIYAKKTILIEESENSSPFYNLFFHNRDHANFVGGDEESGHVVVSIESPGKNLDRRALIRSKLGNERILVPAACSVSRKSSLNFLKSQSEVCYNVKFKEVSHADQALLEYERKEMIRKYKFGVLYAKEGQTTDDEMFSNNVPSQEFDDFLNVLGSRIKLEGFSGYNGGLDVKKNTTGTESVYTKFQGFEIMFHVSTLLPFQTSDEQRIERKRHIGNDCVVIVFKEGKQPFDPRIMKSHFNHNFVVVQVHKKKGKKTIYKMAIANKAGVLPYGPFLPNPPVFEDSASFREFLLAKLINAERSSMNGGEFISRIVRGRKAILKNLVDSLTEKTDTKGSTSSASVSRRNTTSVSKEVQDTLKQQINSDFVATAQFLLSQTGSDQNEFSPLAFKDKLNKLAQCSTISFHGKGKETLLQQAKRVEQLGATFMKLKESSSSDANDVMAMFRENLTLLVKESLNTGESPKVGKQPKSKTRALACFYKEKKMISLPQNASFEELQVIIQRKFNSKDLIIKYQGSSGETKTIASQATLEEALNFPNLKSLYLNLPGEKNDFVPTLELTAEAKSKFFSYVESGQLEQVVSVVDRMKSFVHISDFEGRTPLHVATSNGFFGLSIFLIDQGADCNLQDKTGWSSLHTASCSGNGDLVLYLLKRPNTQVNVVNEDFNTPLHYLAKNPCDPMLVDEIIKLFIKKGEDVNSQNARGETPLHYAALKGNTQMVDTLIKCQADVNIRDGNGESALYYAARMGHRSCVEKLTAAGADTTSKGRDGTASQVAMSPDIVAIIQQAERTAGQKQ